MASNVSEVGLKEAIVLSSERRSVVSRNQIPPSSVPANTSLDLKQIYRQIKTFICQVQTSEGKATGFFVTKGALIAPFHVLKLEPVRKIDENRTEFKINPIQCFYEGKEYPVTCSTPVLDTAFRLDNAIFAVEDPPSVENLSIFQGELEPGEEVYFAGFPLTHKALTFHHGTISSVFEENGISYFTIDGTVVPGNSGGPVFIQTQEGLKLAGIISQQVADFDPEFERTVAILKAMKGRGVNHNVTIHTPQGSEKVRVSETEALGMALDLIQRNLSTGVGRALHAKHLIDLCNGQKFPDFSVSNTGMPAGRKERMPGMLAQDQEYRDWYHRCVKGQPLCGEILGVQLGPNDHISAAQEKVLWGYYERRSPRRGFQGFSPEQQLTHLGKKILGAKPNALRSNGESWKTELLDLQEKIPNSFEKISQLLSHLNG